MKRLRQTTERIGEYDDGSGHRYTVRAFLDARGRPVVAIETGGDVAEIDADEWPLVSDAVDRALEFVGVHPDADSAAATEHIGSWQPGITPSGK